LHLSILFLHKTLYSKQSINSSVVIDRHDWNFILMR